jgi:hypothetical protein
MKMEQTECSETLALLVYEDGTECSETLAFKLQTPGNNPEESIRLNFVCRQPVCNAIHRRKNEYV